MTRYQYDIRTTIEDGSRYVRRVEVEATCEYFASHKAFGLIGDGLELGKQIDSAEPPIYPATRIVEVIHAPAKGTP